MSAVFDKHLTSAKRGLGGMPRSHYLYDLESVVWVVLERACRCFDPEKGRSDDVEQAYCDYVSASIK